MSITVPPLIRTPRCSPFLVRWPCFRGCKSSSYLEQEKCPQFRGVLIEGLIIVQGMEGFYCMTFIVQFGIEWPHMQCSELTFPLSGRIPFSLGVDRGVDTV